MSTEVVVTATLLVSGISAIYGFGRSLIADSRFRELVKRVPRFLSEGVSLIGALLAFGVTHKVSERWLSNLGSSDIRLAQAVTWLTGVQKLLMGAVVIVVVVFSVRPLFSKVTPHRSD